MSTFERTYQTDPSREARIEIETSSIELSDQELMTRATKKKTIDPYHWSNDAKSASKRPKKANKNVSTKSNKPAVARVQKEI